MIAMCVIVAARYGAVSGAFAFLGTRRRPSLHQGLARQIKAEIRWSIISAAIYGMPAGLTAWAWREKGATLIYTEADAYPLWWLPLSLAIALLLQDTWFYWTHRLMHQPSLFKRMHAVHHASRPPTAWAAMSFHPTEALTMAFFVPLLVFVLPLHIGVVGLLLLLMTVMGVTNHMGWEMFPHGLVKGPLGAWVITASHHQGHHQRYDGNYGLYFRFWDRLCGTDRGLGTFGRSPR